MGSFGVKVSVWLGLIVCTAAGAQVSPDAPQPQGRVAAVPVTASLPAARPGHTEVPLLDKPLTLADFAGMAPREDLRAKLGNVGGFIQNQPTDGHPGSEKTEVWMGHTKTALYFVFLCWDTHRELVRGHLARRENITKDDYVSVYLDPFQDRRIGVLFQVNPAGVQADAAYTEANGTDYSYDQVWDSEGKMTSRGWMAMLAIPFRSLRFHNASSDWGVVFNRNFPRNSENDWWPRVSSNVSGLLSQEGTMHLADAEDVTHPHNLQLNPYVLGQSEHELLSLDPNNPYFSTRHAEGTAGGEAKLVVKDSIVLDATVNPDFSDVESDQPQFTVNQRFPVYFPELRPFFLENASYFQTPLTLLYTRNIIRPEFGFRATGKVNHTNLGVLAIDDRVPGQTVPNDDPLHGKRAGFFVGRVSQDVGKNSSVGAMYTDEEFGDGSNRVGGLDFNFRLSPTWTFLGQSVESSTNASRNDSQASQFPLAHEAGPASFLQIQRNARVFNFEDDYTDIARGFVTTAGFLQTANIRGDHAHSTYRWYPKHSWAQSFGLETDQQFAFDHAGNRVYRYAQFDPFLLLKNNIVLAPIFLFNSDTVGPQNGYNISHNMNFAENGAGIVARGQPMAQFNFNVQAFDQSTVNYSPLPGKAPSLLHQQDVQALLTVQPVHQLTADETYLLDRDHDAHTGDFVYETQVFRTKINYQFTRALSARVVAEYDTTLANPAQTALQRTKQIQAQALVTWLPHPGTAIYVGYNSDIQNLSHTLCSRIGGQCDTTRPILPRGSGYLTDGRQLFIKASYLFRF